MRINEKWPTLKKLFLEFLPKEKKITREIAGTERYVYIKSVLTSNASQLYISFAIFVADLLEKFLIKSQTGEPAIHLFYNGIGNLLFELM